jgi:hypothetical protein
MWQAHEDVERVSRARCVDVSKYGLRLRLLHKVPSRATVMFNSHELGIAGRGTVRFCVPRKAAFEIGIECWSGTGWRTMLCRMPRETRPK